MTSPDSEYEVSTRPSTARTDRPTATRSRVPVVDPEPKFDWSTGTIWIATIGLCAFHVFLIWTSLGGWKGISNEWPLLQADHGIHFRHGLLSSHFLKTTGMTAGYDPGFMSGYPMSIVSDLSSTFSDLVMLFAGHSPATGYKLHVFLCASAVPSLVALACVSWKVRPAGILIAVLLDFLYFWTDFPANYAGLGMLNYLLSVPLGLVCLAGMTVYLESGGFARWLWACGSASAVFMVHLTSPMLLAPAVLLAYVAAIVVSRRSGGEFGVRRHLGLWSMIPIVLAVNLFWIWPGYLLRETKGSSELAFAHPESVVGRVGKIFWEETPIQGILIGVTFLGMAVIVRRRPIVAAGLGGLLAAGFGWGYLAGFFRSLDSLQPGRHTYAFYSAATVVAGIGLAEVFDRLRSIALGKWLTIALIVCSVPVFGRYIAGSLRYRVFAAQPFLSSQPPERISWLVSRVQQFVKPGERLLFEESGLAIPGVGDPFEMRHCSAVLPSMAGVELIGGPYLHSTVTTNFTQFGENKLFENPKWDLEFFLRYAKVYRPSAICCWSPKARAFCLANPDLIQVQADDGVVLIGRIKGFGGVTIRGTATVEATPNRLVVRDAVAETSSASDGLVVLRYHAVPYLKADPAAEIFPVMVEDDPVPFIGIRPTSGPLTIKMVLPPRK